MLSRCRHGWYSNCVNFHAKGITLRRFFGWLDIFAAYEKQSGGCLVTKVAIGGHAIDMLWRSTCLLTLLNTIVASTKGTASDCSISKSSFIACIAASLPAFRPHICTFEEALTTSSFVILVTIFPAILRRTSLTPFGLSPGFLSSGTIRDASNASKVVYDIVPEHFLNGVDKSSS